MVFDGWNGLLRVAVVGVFAYLALVLLLRASGKRTLTKLNAFDLVVTVALGSTLATVLLNKSIPLSEGVLGLAVLVGLQYVMAWLSSRLSGFQALIKAEPTLLVHRGRFIDAALKAQRLTREEVFAAMRASGTTSLDSVAAVVLETDGSISVIAEASGNPTEALCPVSGWSAAEREGDSFQ